MSAIIGFQQKLGTMQQSYLVTFSFFFIFSFCSELHVCCVGETRIGSQKYVVGQTPKIWNHRDPIRMRAAFPLWMARPIF
jgi:hypothetical protein